MTLMMTGVQIGLVLIDEVHLLSESRGAALEAGCLSRIRMVACTPHMQHVQPIPFSLHSGQNHKTQL